MAWGKWMVPRLSLSAEAQLRTNLHVIERDGPANVDQLVRIACSLAQQNAYQAAIIRQATGHISALELEAALDPAPTEEPGFVQRFFRALNPLS